MIIGQLDHHIARFLEAFQVHQKAGFREPGQTFAGSPVFGDPAVFNRKYGSYGSNLTHRDPAPRTTSCTSRAIFAANTLRTTMDLHFSKWHGTGNDFILVDDRAGDFPVKDTGLVQRLCDRHFGIGSDGLILIQPGRSQEADFHMEFFNPDASQSFCGNGSRCAFAFWRNLVGDPANARFTAIDGMHQASIDEDNVRVSLSPPRTIERITDDADLMHTGSPHLLVWVKDPAAIDILPAAHAYRYGERFAKEGVNVNFLRWHNGRVEMRTYERGVEAETLSCGTGITAAAIDALHRGLAHGASVAVHTRGGDLRVDVAMDRDRVSKVDLIGPAQHVFSGSYTL